MQKRCFLFTTLFSLSLIIQAQVQQSGWLATFNTFKIKDPFSLHLDVQLRSTDNLEKVQTLIIRPGINYHLTKSVVLTAGYAYIPNRRTINVVSDLLPEHRIWEQILYNHKWSIISSSHRLRYEQRFLPVAVIKNNELDTDGYSKAYRLRYFNRNIIPFTTTAAFTKGLFLPYRMRYLPMSGIKQL